ncbi:unnamed protein product, partial [Ectocarpus sp. 12 AP-2014]
DETLQRDGNTAAPGTSPSKLNVRRRNANRSQSAGPACPTPRSAICTKCLVPSPSASIEGRRQLRLTIALYSRTKGGFHDDLLPNREQSIAQDGQQEKTAEDAAREKAMYNFSGAKTILTAVCINKINTQSAPTTKGAQLFLQRAQSRQGAGCCSTGRPGTFVTAALVERRPTPC